MYSDNEIILDTNQLHFTYRILHFPLKLNNGAAVTWGRYVWGRGDKGQYGFGPTWPEAAVVWAEVSVDPGNKYICYNV